MVGKDMTNNKKMSTREEKIYITKKKIRKKTKTKQNKTKPKVEDKQTNKKQK